MVNPWKTYRELLTRYPLGTKATTAGTLMAISDLLSQTYEQETYRALLTKHGPSINLRNGCAVNPGRATPDSEGNVVQPSCTVPTATSPSTATTSRWAAVGVNAKLLHYDWQRTTHVALTGITFSGPISHMWYNMMDQLIPASLLAKNKGLGISVTRMAWQLALDAFLFSPIAIGGYFIWRTVLENKDVADTIGWKLQYKWFPALQASWSFWPIANLVNFGLVPLPFRVLYNNLLSIFWNAYLTNLNGRRLETVVGDDPQPIPINMDRGSMQNKSPTGKEGKGATSNDTNRNEMCYCSHCRPVRG